jgi:SPP1 family predicted phage head-tail adaptor
MRAGDLDRRVSLLAPSESSDTRFAGNEAAWATAAVFWAKFTDLSGREAIMSQQTALNVSSQFDFRYRTDVTPKCRLLMEGREFEVVSIAYSRRKGEMSVQATEVNVV